MKKSMLIASLLFSSFFAHAVDKGNGGDGIYLNGKLYSLDLVEAGVEEDAQIGTEVDPTILKAVELKLDPAKFPTNLIAAKMTEISKANPYELENLLTILHGFSWSLVNSSLIDIKDENSSLDQNFVQLAVRKSTAIMIDRSLWNELNESNKAALIFHELKYVDVTPILFKTIHVSQRQIYGIYTQDSTIARAEVGRLFKKVLSPSTEIKYIHRFKSGLADVDELIVESKTRSGLSVSLSGVPVETIGLKQACGEKQVNVNVSVRMTGVVHNVSLDDYRKSESTFAKFLSSGWLHMTSKLGRSLEYKTSAECNARLQKDLIDYSEIFKTESNKNLWDKYAE